MSTRVEVLAEFAVQLMLQIQNIFLISATNSGSLFSHASKCSCMTPPNRKGNEVHLNKTFWSGTVDCMIKKEKKNSIKVKTNNRIGKIKSTLRLIIG